ncbi:MAG TPA: FAD-dependent oxidoreductase [Candidatus Eisenbacteria bacterium]|jgi:sarcosine oxidase subunit beta|nr:FAD-dependent oxidoreductase [Candidatus Eisenbacteria bacterium]
MTRASVAVIGAGVVGASVAYHLARGGWREVLLLDRAERFGMGSTGAATGGFRAQFASDVNVRLSLLARERLSAFQQETGVDPGLVAAGYLWLARRAQDLEALRAALAVQRRNGFLDAREVGAREAAALNPALNPDGVLGGTFAGSDGFLRPLAILEGYLRAADRLGVTVRWNAEVTGLRRGPGGIEAVRVGADWILVEAVVNAAGAWAAPVAALADIAVPVAPLRRQALASAPFAGLPETMPMTIWVDDGFHARVRDGRVLALMPTPGDPEDPTSTRVDPAWVASVARTARERIPVLRDADFERGTAWAGLYEMSPDGHALLGAAPGCANLFLANGSSGHGVMHAPALGLLAAEILSNGRASSMDTSALDPGRFAGGTVERRELL